MYMYIDIYYIYIYIYILYIIYYILYYIHIYYKYIGIIVYIEDSYLSYGIKTLLLFSLGKEILLVSCLLGFCLIFLFFYYFILRENIIK